MKSQVYEKLDSNRAFIRDLAPATKEKISIWKEEREALQLRLESGLLSNSKREDLSEKIEMLDDTISVLQENRGYSIKASRENSRLQKSAESIDEQIVQMKEQKNELVEEYKSIESSTSPEEIQTIRAERMYIRPKIETVHLKPFGQRKFQAEASIIDPQISCTED